MKQAEMREVKLSLEVEKEQVEQELLARLRELEAAADGLKRTQQQLRDAQQEAQQCQRRNQEYSAGLADVRQKVRAWVFGGVFFPPSQPTKWRPTD